jgi:hypothetical protein
MPPLRPIILASPANRKQSFSFTSFGDQPIMYIFVSANEHKADPNILCTCHFTIAAEDALNIV